MVKPKIDMLLDKYYLFYVCMGSLPINEQSTCLNHPDM